MASASRERRTADCSAPSGRFVAPSITSLATSKKMSPVDVRSWFAAAKLQRGRLANLRARRFRLTRGTQRESEIVESTTVTLEVVGERVDPLDEPAERRQARRAGGEKRLPSRSGLEPHHALELGRLLRSRRRRLRVAVEGRQ